MAVSPGCFTTKHTDSITLKGRLQQNKQSMKKDVWRYDRDPFQRCFTLSLKKVNLYFSAYTCKTK